MAPAIALSTTALTFQFGALLMFSCLGLTPIVAAVVVLLLNQNLLIQLLHQSLVLLVLLSSNVILVDYVGGN